MAVVGALDASISKYVRGHFRHFARGANLSGIDKSERGCRGRHGGNRQSWKRSWSRVVGLGSESDHAASTIPGDVHSSSSALLVSSKHHNGLVNDDRHVCGADVLWRRIWHHAGVYRRLLRAEECRSHLWLNADGLEFCQRCWSIVYRTHARDGRFVWRCVSCYRWGHGGFKFSAPRGAPPPTRPFRLTPVPKKISPPTKQPPPHNSPPVRRTYSVR